MKKPKPKKSATKPAAPKPVAVKSAATTVADHTSDLPSGALTVTVTQFRSLGSITPLEATLSDWTGFYTPPGVPMPEPPPTLTLTENNMVVSSSGPIQLIFNLPDPRYVQLGVAWKADLQPVGIGEKTFPEVVIQRGTNRPLPYQPSVPGGSCMTVTDNAEDPGNYSYVIVIQEVSTGEIGFYDPGMSNEPN